MISMSRINEGLVSFVRETAAEVYDREIRVISNDEKEPERPSARIFTDNLERTVISACSRFMQISCEIYFYTSDAMQYRTEALQIADILETKLLEPLFITDDFVIYPENVRTEINGSNMLCSFDFSILEEIPQEDISLAEELENSIINCTDSMDYTEDTDSADKEMI